MAANLPSPEDAHNLEKLIGLFRTPFTEVCGLLGVDFDGPEASIEVDNCILMFESRNGYLFSGAVVLDNTYGFFGIKVGANWLKTAEHLEAQGFVQADDFERFTRPGEEFGTCVYLYSDGSAEAENSKVRHYSVCARYGQDP